MKTYSMLELAFLGDAVHTMFVRKSLLENLSLKINDLHKRCSKFCSAKWQSTIFDRIKDNVSQEEFEILRMARNTKPKHNAKNADPLEYHKATGFEALVGWLFLNQKKERLDEILKISIEE